MTELSGTMTASELKEFAREVIKDYEESKITKAKQREAEKKAKRDEIMQERDLLTRQKLIKDNLDAWR